MDSSVCRESLATLIAQESAALGELASLLEHEHELLLKNEVAALESAMEKRQECTGKLVRVEDERRSLCRVHGHAVDLDGLERLLAWCDAQGSLKARWAECATRARRCRDLNDKNSALVNARMKRVESLLEVLTGKAGGALTYGPQGASSVPRAGRVLTAEA